MTLHPREAALNDLFEAQSALEVAKVAFAHPTMIFRKAVIDRLSTLGISVEEYENYAVPAVARDYYEQQRAERMAA